MDQSSQEDWLASGSDAFKAVLGMAAMVPDDEDAHTITYHAIKEVEGKPLEVHASEVAFEGVVSLRPPSGIQYAIA